MRKSHTLSVILNQLKLFEVIVRVFERLFKKTNYQFPKKNFSFNFKS